VIQRNAYQRLLEWKISKDRKPLLLRGARQVGKTTLIKLFAGEFDNYIELNLEREADQDLFEVDSIDKILNATYLLKGVSPGKGSTLLFIDEIQESPKAIQLLRYFYEEKPELYVIAAGSLLEFALKEVSKFSSRQNRILLSSPAQFH
jgi:predicted AAA+ superfamily ATPase